MNPDKQEKVEFEVASLGKFTAYPNLNIVRETKSYLTYAIDLLGPEGIHSEQYAFEKMIESKNILRKEVLEEKYDGRPVEDLDEEERQMLEEEVDRRYYVTPLPSAVAAREVQYRLNALRATAELQELLTRTPEDFDLSTVDNYDLIFNIREAWEVAANEHRKQAHEVADHA